MLDSNRFDEHVGALARANALPLEIATNYCVLIGDTPELDDQGKLVVRDENDVVLARLKWAAGL